jgi:hypothetical protein
VAFASSNIKGVCIVHIIHISTRFLGKASRRRFDGLLLTVGDEFGVWRRVLCVVQVATLEELYVVRVSYVGVLNILGIVARRRLEDLCCLVRYEFGF